MNEEFKFKFQIGKQSSRVNAPVDKLLLPVPSGLARCPDCGEYKGSMALRELPDPHGLHQDEDPGTPLHVRCICEGVLCPVCKINRLHRPLSNVWNERGGFGHVPYFRGWFPCDQCHRKQKVEELAERIDPAKFNFSPKFTAVVGAIIGHDYGARDGDRGGQLTSISITSDGFVMAGSTASEGGGAFIGEASDLERNLENWKNNLTLADRAEFEQLHATNVVDWRHL